MAERAEVIPVAASAAASSGRPTLAFFYSATSGRSRRAEGFLAQVLQRRRNHETFTIHRIDFDAHKELATRLGVEQPPALLVVENKRVRAKLERPRGCVDITKLLDPWLQ